jgi:hypothetical protein
MAASSSSSGGRVSKSYRRHPAPSVSKRIEYADRMSVPISGYIYVNMIANEIRKLPSDVKEHIMSLWTHKNKKRIRLQRLGGTDKRSKARGYVIDNTTVVDGITRRISDWFDKDLNGKGDVPSYMNDLFAAFGTDLYQNMAEKINENDKEHRCKCNNAKKMPPMEHGDLVHKQLYNIVRYAVKRSGMHDDKRPLPASFTIDMCTRSAIVSLLKVGLVPVGSEFPVFSSIGTGSATSIDLICIDTRNGNKMRFIEIKTGNMSKKIQMSMTLSNGTRYSQSSIDAIQIILTTFFGYLTYGDAFFPIESQMEDFGDVVALCYTKSWGGFVMNVPRVVCKMDVVVDMANRVLDRKDGSLRAGLNVNKNTQNTHTVKGTPKKRPAKVLEVGFKHK